MRRILILLLALGVSPGVTAELLPFAFGAHCAHACCRGQDFCERGSGGEHAHSPGTGDTGHGGHHEPLVQEPLAELVVSSVDPPSEACRETCGVVPNSGTKLLGSAPARSVGIVRPTHSTPAPVGARTPAAARRAPGSPRAPPRSEHAFPI